MEELKTYEASITLMMYGIEKMLQVFKKNSVYNLTSLFTSLVHVSLIFLKESKYVVQ